MGNHWGCPYGGCRPRGAQPEYRSCYPPDVNAKSDAMLSRTQRRLLLRSLAALVGAGVAAGAARLSSRGHDEPVVAVAEAHANLLRAEPAIGAVLHEAPHRMQLWFSEEPELRFSEVALFDATRRRLTDAPAQVAPSEPLSLLLDLPPDLADGAYTVVWRVLSKVDGHVTAGSVPFTVGTPGEAESPAPTGVDAAALLGGQDALAGRVDALNVLVRWLRHLGTAAVGGTLVFGPTILAPALIVTQTPRVPGERPASEVVRAWRGGLRASRSLAWFGWWLLLLATLGALIVQTAAATNVSHVEALGAPLLEVVLTTRYGRIWLIWLALVVLLAVLLARASRRPEVRAAMRWRSWGWWWLGVALTGLVLLVTGLVSHSAATLQLVVVALAADWLHLAATALWIGGLFQLLLVFPVVLAPLPPALRLRVLAAAVPRFSRIAVACVAVLVMTGTYQLWLHVGSVEALFTTVYGVTLSMKLALILPLLALGAFNLLVTRPGFRLLARESGARVRAAAAVLTRRFRLAVASEVTLGATVLLLVGFLTVVPPARVLVPPTEPGIVARGTAEDLRVQLRVDPGGAGVNTIAATVRDADGRPVRPADGVVQVDLRITLADGSLGEQEARTEHTGAGVYSAQGAWLSLAGDWQVVVLVRRSGQYDTRVPIALMLPVVAPAPIQPAASAQQPALLAPNLGLALGVVAVAVSLATLLVSVIGPPLLPAWVAIARSSGAVLGATGIIAGFVLLQAGLTPETSSSQGAVLSQYAAAVPPMDVENPIPPTEESLARGRVIYQQHCQVCHGVRGRGDGPAAASLRPPPADLAYHVYQHPDGQFFAWLTRGIPGTAMSAFAATLSEEDRWHVLNYINTFAP